jgi:glycosyltransferase involved in cell wall biosynthesis
MKDLTIIYYTANHISDYFMANTQRLLLEAVGDTPIISVSHKPMKFGHNICVGDIGRSTYNLYKQILIGAREAKTKYVAMAEDDTIYSKEHFAYRPPNEQTFAYDINKWSIFSWEKKPVFSFRARKSMSSLIVSTNALVKTLEERYAKYPVFEEIPKDIYKYYWGEPGRFENHLGITPLKKEEFSSPVPNIIFSTSEALGYQQLGRRKAHTDVTKDEVAPWGSAREVMKIYRPEKSTKTSPNKNQFDILPSKPQREKNMPDLSILIPARNEMFLAKTIENILENIEGNTEIIAVLDGTWSDPGIPDHPKVTLLYFPESIGQRAATNAAAKLSKAKYIMKCDAHCSFDKGFDVKMMQAMHDDWTMVPLMKNLHAFDWVCPNEHRRYQSPSGPCKECGQETQRDILWRAKESPKSVSYCFDSTPHFQYFGDYAKRPEGQGLITETMSLQGSCFMLTREKYWELDICDENFGSWGSQGIEVALKTWLSGGAVMVNKKTWYAHLFRTQGGDFGFPYPMPASQQERAKTTARELFFNDNWPKQVRPLSWLVERFWPVNGWTKWDLRKLQNNTFKFSRKKSVIKPGESEPSEDIPTKGIVFYTDNQLKVKIAHQVQKQLRHVSEVTGIPIVNVSLKPMAHFGDKNIHLQLERGYLTMFKQILAGLEASDAEVIFLCEHDVLYHPSHFDFTPKRKGKFYYNRNFWKLRAEDGHALHYDADQVNGLCAYRKLLIQEYKKRVRLVEKHGYPRSMGFEPGTHDKRSEFWKSEFPIIDIRHGHNLTKNRWSIDEFRNKKSATNWTETDDEIEGWGKTTDLIKNF